jgi:hypothetical protein
MSPEELAEKHARGNAATGNGKAAETQKAPPREFPRLPAEAYHGLAGEITHTIEPHSESDPSLVLISTYIYFGNALGRGPYFIVEGTPHYSNLYALFVGDTSKARKGTGDGRVRQIFYIADELWGKYRIKSGLSSGEGLIEEVRDARTKINKDGDEVFIDEGVSDKRLLIMQPEFGGALQAMRREGSTLSQQLRDGWDGRDLSTMVKHSPSRATAPHISCIGHITATELRFLMDEISMANGFANRYLFVCARRSKVLPFGGNLTIEEVTRLGGKVAAALETARGIEQVTWAKKTAEGWAKIYEKLSGEKPGLLGFTTARAEAQVTRLAMIAALWDGSPLIEPVHLIAAMAIWRYCESSVRYIFDDRVGNPVADTILIALKRAHPQGLTRTELSALFSHHTATGKITIALQELETLGLVAMTHPAAKANGAGRPTERWNYVPA